MEQSQEWVNSKYIKKQARSRKKREAQKRMKAGRTVNYTTKRRITPSSSTALVRSQSQAPSFLETISSLSKRLDLPKIKNQLSEVNEIVHQVGGVIEQINQWRRPVHREMDRPSYPPPEMNPSTGSQSAHRNGSFR